MQRNSDEPEKPYHQVEKLGIHQPSLFIDHDHLI